MLFAERLKTLMIEQNVNQSTLAKNIGYTQRAVSKWVNGEAEPSATAVYLCAKFFDVSADYLLGLENYY
ncbi:MAG: helix-turn-helix transcriptional regulator [Eubacteriales bacterium]|nr:helix-turn-helix transcriptional regulator [Eubacteriales bacterium]